MKELHQEFQKIRNGGCSVTVPALDSSDRTFSLSFSGAAEKVSGEIQSVEW